MAEQREATMARNVKLMPLSGSDKTRLLCKLQRTVHFEKTLSASSGYSNYLKGPSTLTLPAWFVEKHGDKIRKSVILRSESKTKSWTVNLSIFFRTPSITQVRFAGGWRAFALFNGFSEGDSLIFALTAVSEFEVYLFRGKAGSPKEFPSHPSRRRSNDSELARKKANPSHQQLAAEENIGNVAKSNGMIAELKIVGDSKENSVPASGHSPTSCRLSSYSNDLESEKSRSSSPRDRCGHESADDQNKLEVKSEFATRYGPAQRTRARAKNCTECQALALEKQTGYSQQPGFFKKLAVSNFFRPGAAKGGYRTACMEIPLEFWKKHGSRLHSLVKLQGIREESPIQTVVCSSVLQGNEYWRLYLRTGWRDFAAENKLEVGQWLAFTLTGDSFFVVRRLN